MRFLSTIFTTTDILCQRSTTLKITREQWLNEIAELVIEDNLSSHTSLPAPKYRLTMAIMRGKAIGECYKSDPSKDNTNEIQISMACDDSLEVAGVLVHELIHAYDNCASGHKNHFASMARKAGLEGKLTATRAGPKLATQLQEYIDLLGPIPHASMEFKPKQKGRNGNTMNCKSCGFKANLSRKWAEEIKSWAQCPVCESSITVNIK